MGGKFHLKLNIGGKPIANKYREGKMKSTLKRELKEPEIAEMEPLGSSVFLQSFERGISLASLLFWEILLKRRWTQTKCFLTSRLETRTKESNMCASARG